MTGNKTWIWEDNSKSGDFSNLESRHEYQHGNITDAVEAETKELDSGGEAIWWNASIDPNRAVEVKPGQGFNIYESSEDSQGVDYPRRK